MCTVSNWLGERPTGTSTTRAPCSRTAASNCVRAASSSTRAISAWLSVIAAEPTQRARALPSDARAASLRRKQIELPASSSLVVAVHAQGHAVAHDAHAAFVVGQHDLALVHAECPLMAALDIVEIDLQLHGRRLELHVDLRPRHTKHRTRPQGSLFDVTLEIGREQRVERQLVGVLLERGLQLLGAVAGL